MSLLKRIGSRLQRDYFRYQYQMAAKHVLKTPPLERGSASFVLLSMVHQRDLTSYLIALKSFARQENPRRVVMVCDPSITDAEREVVRYHVPHIELRRADEFRAPEIPRGGTWERLYAISEYVRDSYVIQLDADTVTLSSIPEVTAAISAGHGFVLGEEPAQLLMSLAEASKRARPKLSASNHIQTLCEAALEETGLPSSALYVRGCSGFTGFPAHTEMRPRLLDFSVRMQGRFGALWESWGTEQVTSNYLAANAPETRVLPFPKYATPDVLQQETAFLHFIGSMRFVNATYERTARRVIDVLNR